MRHLLTTLLIFAALAARGQQSLRIAPLRIWGETAIGKRSDADPASCSWLEIGADSTTRGLLGPRVLHLSSLTGTIKRGLLVYLYDSAAYCFYNGSAWVKWGTGSGGGSTDLSSYYTKTQTDSLFSTVLDTASDAKQIALTAIYGLADLDTTKQNNLIVTTVGSSGPATLSHDTLNIPQYTAGSGLGSLNGSTQTSQTFATGTSGADFGISTNTGTGVHTFNLPTVSGSNRGVVTSSLYNTWQAKQDALTAGNGILISSNTLILDTTGTKKGATNGYVDRNFPNMSGSYANPSWISSLAWAKITGTPTIDAIPTNGSTNAVSSDGVFDAEALKAPLASPVLTGIPTAPTASVGTNTTQIATMAAVNAAATFDNVLANNPAISTDRNLDGNGHALGISNTPFPYVVGDGSVGSYGSFGATETVEMSATQTMNLNVSNGSITQSAKNILIGQVTNGKVSITSDTLFLTKPKKASATGFDSVLTLHPTTRQVMFVPKPTTGTGSVTSIATTSPITGGTITTTGTIGINDAAADGSTKGASTYTASDFNATSGLISIDYTNGQAADGTHKGFLTSSDWTTFNGKLGSEVDGSVTNEGLLTVSGGATPVLSSNTSGNTDVSFTGTGGITVSQDVGGPNILNFNIGSSAIAISKLAITGTPTGSKYLRDDGSWQPVAGGGGATIASTTSILKGDGAGNGVAATLGTDYQQTPDIQTYSTAGSFTWTKPANARRVFVTVIGGGGGGGSGSKAATGVSATGGAGGAGGGISQLTFDASDLTSTVSVTVGAGGAGGASQTTNSSTGNTGVSGGISSFGNYLRAVNGTGGATGATAGVAGTGLVSSGGNGGTGGVTSSGIQSGAHNMGAAGGGGGGAISAANTAASGAAGNVAATFGAAANPTTNAGSSGASGTTGASPVGYSYYGGGGGASSTSTNGGAGAAPGSGNYGAGGGGGGAARDSVGNSGAGGNGADGAVIVVTYF